MRSLLVFCVLSQLILVVNPLSADIVRYTDSAGRIHYTDDPSKIPDQYRDQLQHQKPLPKLNKVPARELAPSGNPEYAQSRNRGRRVEIFVTSWCAYCQQLEGFLKSKRIGYKRYDIEKSREGLRIYQQLGGGGVPMVRVGSTVIYGYKPAAIERALNR